MPPSPERMGQAFQRALRHWRHHPVEEQFQIPVTPAQIPFTIAISRETGAGGEVVAEELASRLDWPVYDRELIEKVANESGLSQQLLESLDERQSDWLTECVSAASGHPMVNSATFGRHLAKTLMALAAHGRCVVVGRGAAVILPEATTLRVRLIAPLGVRIARIRGKHGMGEREANQLIADRDKRRREFVRAQFHRDVDDVHSYDLVLNTGRFTVSQCVELIMNSLRDVGGTFAETSAARAVVK